MQPGPGTGAGAGKLLAAAPLRLHIAGGAAALGTPAICWSVDTEDWKSRNVDSILDIVLRQAGDGDILLLHDCYPTSVTAALEIVDRLQPRGVQFVTVEELFAVKGVQPACGTLYRRVRGE